VFRVGAAELATTLAIAAGFGAPARPAADRVWRLGNLSSGRVVFLALEISAIAADGIATTLRHVAQGSEITILAPGLPAGVDRRFRDAGFHLVETLTALSPASNALGAFIDLSMLVPIPLAPILRVRTATAEIQWDGRFVILSHQLFPVFKRLLEKALSRDPIASGSHVEDTTGREAKDLIRELRDAFKAAGFTDAESKNLIVTVRGRGYRLGVVASDITIDG
jgi:hypothetical protein